MDEEFKELHFYHGGVLEKGFEWIYKGGDKMVFNQIDPEMIDYFWMFKLAQKCGDYGKIKDLYFHRPKQNLRNGLKRLVNDDDIREMEHIAKMEGFVALYVIHDEADLKGKRATNEDVAALESSNLPSPNPKLISSSSVQNKDPTPPIQPVTESGPPQKSTPPAKPINRRKSYLQTPTKLSKKVDLHKKQKQSSSGLDSILFSLKLDELITNPTPSQPPQLHSEPPQTPSEPPQKPSKPPQKRNVPAQRSSQATFNEGDWLDNRPDSPLTLNEILGDYRGDFEQDSDSDYKGDSEPETDEEEGSGGDRRVTVLVDTDEEDGSRGTEEDESTGEPEELIEEQRFEDTDFSDEEGKTLNQAVLEWNRKKKLELAEIRAKVLEPVKICTESGSEKRQTAEPSNTDGFVSEYEDSDADVLTPGESEDDDILGKKRKATEVPVVDCNTDFTRFKWVEGIRFPTRAAFKDAVRRYAIAQGRDLTYKVSDKKRNNRLGVQCREGCPFYLYASWEENRQVFIVKTVRGQHTCTRDMNKNRQLTSRFMAEEFLHIFQARPHWPAKEIVAAVKRKFRVCIKRNRAYKIKAQAHKLLHGSMKDHYLKLGSYIEALKNANPNGLFEMDTVPNEEEPDGPPVFQRLFVCFDGLRDGLLQGCRKVLCIDGCFLKTFLGGMLLAAVGRDSNGQMFPVAWAVAEGETNESWLWFLTRLKKCLHDTTGHGWTLISDQQKGLVNAVASIFPNAEHRNCARHIFQKWHKTYKGDELKGLFWRCVKAYNLAEFNEAFIEMKNVSPEAAEAFECENPRMFCRCFFKTHTKCDVVVNNMAETFNGYIINARSKHIIDMLEDIRSALMARLVVKRHEISKWIFDLCPKIQEKLELQKEESKNCHVLPSSDTVFQVSHSRRRLNLIPMLDELVVNLEGGTCTCRQWDLRGIPCCHAVAAVFFLRGKAEDLVNDCYNKATWMRAYAGKINPVPGERHWPAVDCQVDPPPIKIGPGRPKKNRKKDPHEDPKRPGKLTRHGQILSCSVCKAKDHTKRKCTLKDDPRYAPPPKRGRGRPVTIPKEPVSTDTSHHQFTAEPASAGTRGRKNRLGIRSGASSGGTGGGGGRGRGGGGRGRGGGGRGRGRDRTTMVPAGIGAYAKPHDGMTYVNGRPITHVPATTQSSLMIVPTQQSQSSQAGSSSNNLPQ